jgi:hypothetical protein
MELPKLNYLYTEANSMSYENPSSEMAQVKRTANDFINTISFYFDIARKLEIGGDSGDDEEGWGTITLGDGASGYIRFSRTENWVEFGRAVFHLSRDFQIINTGSPLIITIYRDNSEIEIKSNTATLIEENLIISVSLSEPSGPTAFWPAQVYPKKQWLDLTNSQFRSRIHFLSVSGPTKGLHPRFENGAVAYVVSTGDVKGMLVGGREWSPIQDLHGWLELPPTLVILREAISGNSAEPESEPVYSPFELAPRVPTYNTPQEILQQDGKFFGGGLQIWTGEDGHAVFLMAKNTIEHIEANTLAQLTSDGRIIKISIDRDLARRLPYFDYQRVEATLKNFLSRWEFDGDAETRGECDDASVAIVSEQAFKYRRYGMNVWNTAIGVETVRIYEGDQLWNESGGNITLFGCRYYSHKDSTPLVPTIGTRIYAYKRSLDGQSMGEITKEGLIQIPTMSLTIEDHWRLTYNQLHSKLFSEDPNIIVKPIESDNGWDFPAPSPCDTLDTLIGIGTTLLGFSPVSNFPGIGDLINELGVKSEGFIVVLGGQTGSATGAFTIGVVWEKGSYSNCRVIGADAVGVAIPVGASVQLTIAQVESTATVDQWAGGTVDITGQWNHGYVSISRGSNCSITTVMGVTTATSASLGTSTTLTGEISCNELLNLIWGLLPLG